MYENIVSKIVNNDLAKWSSTNYLFRASLCQIMLGNFDIEKYEKMLPHVSFKKSIEGKFLIDVYDALKGNDLSLFTDIVTQYNDIKHLSAEEVSTLLQIKNKIQTSD